MVFFFLVNSLAVDFDFLTGVDVSVEEIVSSVSLVLQENMKAIMEQRYWING